MGESTRQTPCQPRDGVNYRQGATVINRLFGGFTPFLIADILKSDFSCRARGVACEMLSPAITPATTMHRDVEYSMSEPPIDLTCKNRRRRDESDSDCSESSSSSSSLSSCSREKRAASTSAGELMWPAWVYCTRYSDRPSAGEYDTAVEPSAAIVSGSVCSVNYCARLCSRACPSATTVWCLCILTNSKNKF